jgi:lysozyme
MRFSKISFAVLTTLLSGCTSASDMSALNVQATSFETTSSIAVPARPIPQHSIGQQSAPSAPQLRETEFQVPLPETMPFVEPQKAHVTKAVLTGKTYHSRFKDADPVSFGRASPKNFAVHGVDVSRWQGDINWNKLRSQGANFAYIKSTDGGDHIDPMFKKNWNNAGKAGLKRGAYHFFYWCRSGAEQAKWFIQNVPKSPNALPPVIDVEYNHLSNCKKRPSTETVLKKMQSFMDIVEAHYGQRPVIYTAPDFYEDHLKGQFTNYPFWLRSVASHPSERYPDRDWVFWQYSGTGLSHGVKGEIDLNVFNGDASSWRHWLSKTSG